AVAEGEIEIATTGGGALRLLAGQGAAFTTHDDPALSDDAGHVAALRNGRLVFAERPPKAVLADLERHGAGRFVILDGRLAERAVSGSLDLSAPSEALRAVLDRADARAMRLGGVVFVSRR